MTNTPAEVSPTIDPVERAVGAEDASKPGDVVGSVRDERGAVGLFTFAEFSAWTAFAAIVCALTLPLVLDGLRPHTVLFNYFHVMFGALGWKLVGPTAQHQESTDPTSPPAEQSSSAVKALP